MDRNNCGCSAAKKDYKGGTAMKKSEIIDGLIANEATQFTDEDRDWLEVMHEDQLTKMVPKENEQEPKKEEPCCPDEVAALIANEASPFTADDAETLNALTADQLDRLQPKKDTGDPKPTTLEAYIDAAPAEMQDMLRAGVIMHRAKKDGLVEKILANKRNKFTKEQLSVKGLDELEAISELAHAPDYSGGGGHTPLHNESKEEALETPEMKW